MNAHPNFQLCWQVNGVAPVVPPMPNIQVGSWWASSCSLVAACIFFAAMNGYVLCFHVYLALYSWRIGHKCSVIPHWSLLHTYTSILNQSNQPVPGGADGLDQFPLGKLKQGNYMDKSAKSSNHFRRAKSGGAKPLLGRSGGQEISGTAWCASPDAAGGINMR